MLPLLACVAVLQTPNLTRDDYGVPHIFAITPKTAYFFNGYAVAEDRLWQMENSRRVARGRMAEVFGPSFVASDKEVLAQAYTDEELEQQYQSLSPDCRQKIDDYVEGVNKYISNATEKGTLPSGYAANGFKPVPWTRLDTVAITIRLFQQFGKGGAGEIRNMALLGYLQGRKNLDVLNVLEDFAWQNDKTSPTTIADSDDPLARPHPVFPVPSRSVSEKHIASLPKVGLLELLPGVRLAERVESTKVAEKVSAPSKWGSYCIVVSPTRSATGYPVLLSGPQMGFRNPSIVHEISIQAPGLDVVGMDVPGVPGVAIGHNGYLAWGLTSGVADTDDIFYNTYDASGYRSGGVSKPFQDVTFQLPVKGSDPQTVVQRRTEWGPVVVDSRSAKVVFSRCSSSRMKEMLSFQSVSLMNGAKSVSDVEAALRFASVNFNCFFATTDGQIGYRYTGFIPLRSASFDPRFPVPGEPANKWPGMVDFASMPHVMNPKAGLLVNWNNKPVSWWTNSDTPVWGRIFRNSEILASLPSGKVSVADVEKTAWTIARRDETWPSFKPFVEKALEGFDSKLQGFDGWMLDGSYQAQFYKLFFDDLRDQLFLDTTGNFVSPDNFKLVGQPSVMLKALEGKTRVDYLHGRKAVDVVRAALTKTASRMPGRFVAPGIPVTGQSQIPYSNRGTYIQIVELLKDGPSGRNVVTPGVAESGPHSQDQAPLARAWLYKPMLLNRR